jgi:Rrf2 family protein
MAGQKQQDKPVASHHIAEEAGREIPGRFLLKVLKPLVSARVLLSIKGPNGGYRLAKEPSKISVLDIIEAVDGPIRGSVVLDDKGNGQLLSKLETICQQTAEQVRQHLDKVKVSEIAIAPRKKKKRRAAAESRREPA